MEVTDLGHPVTFGSLLRKRQSWQIDSEVRVLTILSRHTFMLTMIMMMRETQSFGALFGVQVY
ncbi:hypothetical protein ACFL6T_02220 [Candidatus Zixiibacteriota bacterium]